MKQIAGGWTSCGLSTRQPISNVHEHCLNTFTKFYNILITCFMQKFVTSDEIPIILLIRERKKSPTS